jgi:exoribonuclease-2
MEPGNIVEYIDRQKIQCAVVLDVKNQRLRLLSENAREVTLSSQRLSHRSSASLDPTVGREAMIQSLKETAARRIALGNSVDIPSLWEVLNTEQQWIDLATMTGFVFPGAQDADHESAVVRAFFKNRLYFKFKPDAFFPYTEEQARQARNKAEKEEKRKRLIQAGATWLKTVLSDNGKKPLPAAISGDRQEVVDILKAYYLFGKDSASHAVAKTILADTGIKSPETIFQILVKVGAWDTNENLDLHYYKPPMDFPEEIRQHASRLKENADRNGETTGAAHNRKDLTDLRALTIDGQSTLDFDDALSIEDMGSHYLLGVHISDVGAHIRKGDAMDQEALSRASSIYMPDRKIPMLPAELSEDLCSLVAGRRRLAISAMVKITPAGDILDSEIFASTVAINRQLSYSDANAMADSDPDISLLHAIGLALRRKRLDNGAVHISLPEISIQVANSEAPTVTRVERETPSRMLIAEIMILANSVMADFLKAHGMPAIFRSQPGPRERLYQRDTGSLFQNWMQRKHLSRFALGTTPERHDGLGLDAYVTATSPIRKYYDLITQRQIRAVLGLEPAYPEEEIAALLQRLEHPMGYVPRLQYSRNRYWLLKHLETRIGQKEEAIVLSRRKGGYQILLPSYMVECFMPISGSMKLKPEDYIQITFQHVNARKDDLTVFMG